VTSDYFQRNHGGAIPDGLLRTVVPAAPDAWITALEHYGTMSFADCAAAAIRFASDGFPMHRFMSDQIRIHEAEYRRWPQNVAIYLPNGRPPEPGEIFVQADLGRTIQYMADEERAAAHAGRAAGLSAAPNAFYRGDIARAIVRFHQENDGLLSEQDLAEFRVGIEPPVKACFAGIDVYACGPWCQGPVVPQLLKLLERFDLKGLGHNSLDYAHVVLEASKLVFADRERYYGDPRFVSVPMDTLLSEDLRPAAPGDDPGGPGLAGHAAVRRHRGLRPGREPRREWPRRTGGRARHLVHLRRRPARQRVLGHPQRLVVRHGGGARHRPLPVAAWQPELGRSRAHLLRRAG
jgi:gamma-glutamyltranspeptidase/glutathione hydrolase